MCSLLYTFSPNVTSRGMSCQGGFNTGVRGWSLTLAYQRLYSLGWSFYYRPTRPSPFFYVTLFVKRNGRASFPPVVGGATYAVPVRRLYCAGFVPDLQAYVPKINLSVPELKVSEPELGDAFSPCVCPLCPLCFRDFSLVI